MAVHFKHAEKGGSDGAMKLPTDRQVAAFDKKVQGMLATHKIATADVSRINPYLMVLIMPMSEGVAKIKAFANDLFHSLCLLPAEMLMDISEANNYCAIDADEEHGEFLVFVNNPAIFDYPEDSQEGQCAYAFWHEDDVDSL